MQPEYHPYYTEIQRRSYDAIVQNEWLSEVVLAFVVDPKNPYKIGDQLVRDDHQRLVIVPDDPQAMPLRAPITPSDVAKMGHKAQTLLRLTIEQWAARQPDARSAMEGITLYDGRLGAWCASRLCKEVLASSSPRISFIVLAAIATTEQWSLGRGSQEDAMAAGRLAAEYAEEMRTRSLFGAYIGYAAAYAAAVAVYASMPAESAERAGQCAVFAARAMASRPLEDGPYRVAQSAADEHEELVRLRSAVAKACRSWPLLP